MPLKRIEHLDRATSHEEIAEFERKLNIDLPDDYRTFLLAHNVCRPVPNTCLISEEQGEDTVRYFFGFSEKEYFSLEEASGVYKDKKFPRIPREALPIGEDDGGNLYCIITEGENRGSVYFWDHDWENEGNPDYTNMYLLAGSFTDFLNQLYESK